MALTEREKHEKEVKDLQDANAERLVAHVATEVHETVDSDKSKPVEVHAFGGSVYLNTHGEARLDSTQALNLIQHLQAAFQAVS